MKNGLTKKQLADYEQLCRDRNSGRVLTPDGLRLICAACNYDTEAIGKHFLELLPKICPQ
ncbi:MAG TPA: cytochrome C [Lachnospiraceae bacterium]|nr:cytochrome C [Lachnospiraceae bacterium]